MKVNELYNTMFREYGDMLEVRDVQAMLGIGRKAVYQLIEDKAIYAVKIGKGYKISKIRLIEYLVGNDKIAA